MVLNSKAMSTITRWIGTGIISKINGVKTTKSASVTSSPVILPKSLMESETGRAKSPIMWIGSMSGARK